MVPAGGVFENGVALIQSLQVSQVEQLHFSFFLWYFLLVSTNWGAWNMPVDHKWSETHKLKGGQRILSAMAGMIYQ